MHQLLTSLNTYHLLILCYQTPIVLHYIICTRKSTLRSSCTNNYKYAFCYNNNNIKSVHNQVDIIPLLSSECRYVDFFSLVCIVDSFPVTILFFFNRPTPYVFMVLQFRQLMGSRMFLTILELNQLMGSEPKFFGLTFARNR